MQGLTRAIVTDCVSVIVAEVFILRGGRISKNMPPGRARAWASRRVAFAVVGVLIGALGLSILASAAGL